MTRRSIPPYNHPSVRILVWDMTDGHCIYCGVRMNPFRDFTIDHMVPRCLGGTDELSNLVPACLTCNCRKGVVPFEEWLERNHYQLFFGSRCYREQHLPRHTAILNSWVEATYGDWESWERGDLVGGAM